MLSFNIKLGWLGQSRFIFITIVTILMSNIIPSQQAHRHHLMTNLTCLPLPIIIILTTNITHPPPGRSSTRRRTSFSNPPTWLEPERKHSVNFCQLFTKWFDWNQLGQFDQIELDRESRKENCIFNPSNTWERITEIERKNDKKIVFTKYIASVLMVKCRTRLTSYYFLMKPYPHFTSKFKNCATQKLG